MFEGRRGVFSTFPHVLSRCELSDSHKREKRIEMTRSNLHSKLLSFTHTLHNL